MHSLSLAAASVLVICMALSGCASKDLPRNSWSSQEPRPPTWSPGPRSLLTSSLHLHEDQETGLGPDYLGTIRFPYCLWNTNEVDVRVQYGYELYQVQPPRAVAYPLYRVMEKSALKMVQQWKAEPLLLGGGDVVRVFNDTAYQVFLKEVQSGQTTQYALHLWNQILHSGPIDVVLDHGYNLEDHWYNLTLTPHTTANFVEEQDSSPCLQEKSIQHNSNATGPNHPAALEIVSIHVQEEQFGGVDGIGYWGSLSFPHCIYNPNQFETHAQYGYEVYQLLPGTTLQKIVLQWDSGKESFEGTGWFSKRGGGQHHIFLSETSMSGSTNYTLHFWHQIFNPNPTLREDRWYNMTFIPFEAHDFANETHSFHCAKI